MLYINEIARTDTGYYHCKVETTDPAYKLFSSTAHIVVSLHLVLIIVVSLHLHLFSIIVVSLHLHLFSIIVVSLRLYLVLIISNR